jgi:5,10-methenyltetrahydrofolate synthetase
MAWRRSERTRLIEARLAIDAGTRGRYAERIAAGLDAALGDVAGLIVSAYWPFKGEPDLRPWLETLPSRGGSAALPIVIAKGEPLKFRRWRRGEALTRGVWNIPVPAEGDFVVPDVVIAPVVGFDSAAFRLGYGGGFFDRTLAALPGRRAVGVGYTQARIATIHPLPHDIAMDFIVTEEGIVAPA